MRKTVDILYLLHRGAKLQSPLRIFKPGFFSMQLGVLQFPLDVTLTFEGLPPLPPMSGCSHNLPYFSVEGGTVQIK